MNEDGVTSENPNPSLPKPPSSPPTPAASSAGASSPAVPANAGNGEGRLRRRDKSSADSHMVVGSVLHGASNPSCRPWERGDLLRRLSTFKLAGKMPKVAGSLACAKRGWVNVDVAKIECELCGAQLDFALPSASSFEGEAIVVMVMANFVAFHVGGMLVLVDCYPYRLVYVFFKKIGFASIGEVFV